MMEFIIELLLDLIFEGSTELISNKKVPKYIRYPLIGIATLFFIISILIITFIGVLVWDENIWVGILMFVISIVFLISGIVKFRKLYFEKNNKKS